MSQQPGLMRYLPLAIFFFLPWHHDTCGPSLRAVVTHREREGGTNSLSVPTARFLAHAMPFETLLWLLAARLIVPLAAVCSRQSSGCNGLRGAIHSYKCICVTADCWHLAPANNASLWRDDSRIGVTEPPESERLSTDDSGLNPEKDISRSPECSAWNHLFALDSTRLGASPGSLLADITL